MSQNEITQVVSLDASLTRATLAGVMLKRSAYVLLTSEDSRTITMGTALAAVKDGIVFYRDDADTTTAHDGIATLVSSEGTRYKSSGIPRLYSVLTITNTPPGSPTVGAAYLVGTAPSGAWASNANMIAVWSKWGWRFSAALVGQLVFVQDIGAFYHFNTSGVWTQGTGALSVSTTSVRPKSMLFPAGISVAAVTNTPPGSPADGVAYIVGTTPTGGFVGQAGALAVYRSAGTAWDFSAPYVGMSVWDQGTSRTITYLAGVWGASSVQSPVRAEAGFQSNDAGITVANVGAVHTFPVNNSGYGTSAMTPETMTISYACLSATSRIRVTYQCIFIGGSAVQMHIVMLQRDTDAAPVDYFAGSPVANGSIYQSTVNCQLYYAPGDTALHLYTVRLGCCAATAVVIRRRIYLQEIA